MLRTSTFSTDRLGFPPTSSSDQSASSILLSSSRKEGEKALSRGSAQALSLLAFKTVAILLRQVKRLTF